MKYQVFKRLGANWSPSFEQEFNDIDDARLYRNLMQKTEDEKDDNPSTRWQYYIAEVIE